MQNGKKPVERRRIGPAMQWAKSRAETQRAQDQFGQRINIDLEDDWDNVQSESEVSNQDSSFQEQYEDDQAESRHPGSNNASTSSFSYRSPWSGESLESQHNGEFDDGSAWAYYSGQSNHDTYENAVPGASPYGQTYPNYNQTSYQRLPQMSGEGFDTVPQQIGAGDGNQREGPGLRQLLPALLVVMVIVIAGLLASLG